MKTDRSYRKALLPDTAKRVFEGNMFDVYQWEQTLYDGSKQTFEKLSRPDTVTVFPVLEDANILLIEDSQPHRDTWLTTPGGRVEEGETPEIAARRELLEETGYEAGELELLFLLTPEDKIDWVFYVFVGRRCKKVGEPQPDAGEKIIQKPVSFETLLRLAADGTLRGTRFSTMAFQAQHNPAAMIDLKKKFFE